MQRKSKYDWVLCSENWQDFVFIHVPQLNVTPIEDNYANLSTKEIKNTYFRIVIARDCARKDQRRPSIIIWMSIGTFFVLLIEKHSLELATISLTYFVKMFVNNPAKKKQDNNLPSLVPHLVVVTWRVDMLVLP